MDGITDASEHGHLEVIQWLRTNGCDWDYRAVLMAVRNGHFEVARWLADNGCPWDWWAISQASQNGHKEIAEWFTVQWRARRKPVV